MTLERPLPPSSKRKMLPQSFAVKGGGDIRYVSCPFEKVLPLVRSRRVLLRDGKALLSPVQVPEAVVQHFEGRLREGMAVAERGLPGVEADVRVAEVLRQVRRAVDSLVSGGWRHGRDADNRSTVAITRKNIDQLAEKHFPLCMRRTLRILRREHHLKYQARLQLISFLGNAGMEVRASVAGTSLVTIHVAPRLIQATFLSALRAVHRISSACVGRISASWRVLCVCCTAFCLKRGTITVP